MTKWTNLRAVFVAWLLASICVRLLLSYREALPQLSDFRTQSVLTELYFTGTTPRQAVTVLRWIHWPPCVSQCSMDLWSCHHPGISFWLYLLSVDWAFELTVTVSSIHNLFNLFIHSSAMQNAKHLEKPWTLIHGTVSKILKNVLNG
jgi:hypothetical protein